MRPETRYARSGDVSIERMVDDVGGVAVHIGAGVQVPKGVPGEWRLHAVEA